MKKKIKYPSKTENLLEIEINLSLVHKMRLLPIKGPESYF